MKHSNTAYNATSDVTEDWLTYERGKDYNNSINLYNNVDKVERFVAGDQWKGVVNNGLPLPVFNIMKRVITHFIAAVLSQKVKMQFSPAHVPEPPDPNDPEAQPEDPNDKYHRMIGEVLNDEADKLWERLKMDTILRFALKDSAVSGDMAGWSFWNELLKTAATVEGAQPMGDIDFNLLDNVQVYFDNVNDRDVQRQPGILVAFRSLVKDLRREAEANGLAPEQIELIVGDSDTQEMAGDRGKLELDVKGDSESAKCTTLLRLWKVVDEQTGDETVYWRKSVKAVTIIEEVNTGLSLYPVVWGSWDFRKNSYHGQPIGLELIPNQIYVNKMFAMVMKSMMNTAFPKVIYNTSLIKKWDNRIDKAIPVNATEDINKVAMYLRGADVSQAVMATIDAAVKYTMDFLGANDAMLGNIKPDNHSAIVAVTQNAMIPLETIKGNLYQWVEDLARIWYDMMANFYGVRQVIYQGQRVAFDFAELKEIQMNIKIDVGPSTYWSEIASAQTLDGLLKAGKIEFLQYLERMPDGFIPQKQELIEDIKKAIKQQEEQAKAMAAQQAEQAKAMALSRGGGQPPGGQPGQPRPGSIPVEEAVKRMPPQLRDRFLRLPVEQQKQMLLQASGGMVH